MIIRKKKIVLSIIFALLFCTVALTFNNKVVHADELSDSIEEQLGNLELKELEDFFNSVTDGLTDIDFITYVNKLLNGEFNLDSSSATEYIINIFLSNVIELIPTLISIIAICILCGIVQSSKGSFLSDGVAEITFFVCMMGVILLLSTEILTAWRNVEKAIKSIAKLTEIMSPIIITLMLAVGGNVSASVYKPTVTFLTGGVINAILYLVMPLILMMSAFSMASNFSSSIKLNKFTEFANSAIKWILGLVVAIFGLFLSVQGITSAHYDGISIKAAKYAISNSVPIIGGFLKDGFDMVVAGSVLIKNAIGVATIFVLFYIILSPVIYLAVFSMLLKLVAAIIEPVCDVRLSNFCTSISKTASYLTAALLTVGFMLFITVILMIMTANAFI